MRPLELPSLFRLSYAYHVSLRYSIFSHEFLKAYVSNILCPMCCSVVSSECDQCRSREFPCNSSLVVIRESAIKDIALVVDTNGYTSSTNTKLMYTCIFKKKYESRIRELLRIAPHETTVLSTDLKVRTTLYNTLNSTT